MQSQIRYVIVLRVLMLEIFLLWHNPTGFSRESYKLGLPGKQHQQIRQVWWYRGLLYLWRCGGVSSLPFCHDVPMAQLLVEQWWTGCRIWSYLKHLLWPLFILFKIIPWCSSQQGSAKQFIPEWLQIQWVTVRGQALRSVWPLLDACSLITTLHLLE